MLTTSRAKRSDTRNSNLSRSLTGLRKAPSQTAAAGRLLWNRLLVRPILLVLGGLAAFAIFFGIWVFLSLAPVNRQDSKDESMVIPVGSGLGKIASLLGEAGLIRAPFAFKVYARLTGAEHRLRAGDYRLSRSMSGQAILKKLARGEQATVTVTFPEGVTNEEIARILAGKGLVDAEAFLAFLGQPDFRASYSDLTDARSPEGFLFPDTYRINQGAPLDEIARMQTRRFREVFTAAMAEKAHQDGMTISQVITLASIIEEEARVPSERPLISAVFHNRLRLGRPLESCATVQYALGVHKKRLSYDDLKVNSPYNTYRHTGLPPGPIANPGLDSIRAALYPAKVHYLYFVARDDGTHVFSRTYSEHLRAQRTIKRQQ